MAALPYFTARQKVRLVRSLARRTSPAYVQFYVTARCHLACEQCNIVYADGDAPELTLDEIRAAAENLAAIGVCVVLLIGGEPFVRKDLPEIVEAFTRVGIHVRLQTAGLASRDALERCVAAGAHDISVSLDTLDPALQDRINGGFAGSWSRAIDVAATINEVFPANGTAFFGTVLMPSNVSHVPEVLEFATRIGWSVSLVPVHVSGPTRPRGFRALDADGSLAFTAENHERVRAVVKDLKARRRAGQHLYDSDEYLDDVVRFATGQPVRWRRRNGDVCDAPSLYFAIDPAGRVAPCCDYRLSEAFPVHDERFPTWFRDGVVHRASKPLVEACDGCMYGSYPEITVTSRFFVPLARRTLFFQSKRPALAKLSADEMRAIAAEIRARSAAAGRASS